MFGGVGFVLDVVLRCRFGVAFFVFGFFGARRGFVLGVFVERGFLCFRIN